jgi:hypothetical protein
MSKQRGSVLIGVMALSLLMTIAASGFILVTANTANDGLGSAANRQLHYAAESGLYLGIRWARSYDVGDPAVLTIDDPTWWADGLVLTKDQYGTAGFADIDGMSVMVILGPDPAGGRHRLTSLATAGPGQDTLEIFQAINFATQGDRSGSGDASILCSPAMDKWVETVHPGKH